MAIHTGMDGMEVITIESRAYKELMDKLNSIARYVEENKPDPRNPDNDWVDSYEVRTYLKISERTLQRLRSENIISYTVLAGKSYYTIAEIKRMLAEKQLKCNEEYIQDLIDNHKLYVQQR
jgi:predicted nucleotidyltransferase